jgi:hypothetical protein
MRPPSALYMLHKIRILFNIRFMAQPRSNASPLNELCSALPSLPMRLQQVGRFVAVEKG